MRKGIASVFGVILTVCLIMIVVHTHNERQSVYEFTDEGRWIVEDGDTLWKIAHAYSDNRHDVRQVVYIIRQLNDNCSPIIYAGQEITVPLFNCMDWEYWDGE